MIDTTQSCAGSGWPDTSLVTHGEYESGFLLPQLMGALANESGGYGVLDLSQRTTNGAVFLKLYALLMQAFKRR